MNMYFRLLWLILSRLFVKQAADPFSPCSSNFRVNLFDLDINFHMNNGRYLTLMDLGRVDLLLKCKMFWKLLLNGYYPVVTSEAIKFKQSLEPFDSFDLLTFIESWDEKDFYMLQTFSRKNKIVAEGYIKARFKKRGRSGSLSTSEIFEFLGMTYNGPRMSELAQAHLGIDSKLARTHEMRK
jgi:acyl-CoA thioesterase FadM